MQIKFSTLFVSCILASSSMSLYSKKVEQPKFNEGFKGCTNIFQGKVAPLIMDKKISKNTYPICFTGFAVNYSGVSKTGLFSAEYITYDSLQKAKKLSREDSFHEESRIPLKYRALLSDYRGSGMDRGHLSANGNRYNRVDQHESFSLANIIPQAPKNNQENWRNLEEATRTIITKTKQPAYVITGSLFLNKKTKKIGKGVLVPSHVYKVVYYPTFGVASAYVSVNDNIAMTDITTVMQLQKYSGITFFPAIGDVSLLNKRYALPLSANAAYKLNDFRLMQNVSSNIFDIMPDHSIPSPYVNNNQNVASDKKATQQQKKIIAGLNKEYEASIKQATGVIKSIF